MGAHASLPRMLGLFPHLLKTPSYDCQLPQNYSPKCAEE
jgi:hypothetical protein